MCNLPWRVQLHEQVKLLGVRPSHFNPKKCNDIKGLDDGMC